jgi:hypothetical protein
MNEIPKPEMLFELSRNTLQDLQIASLDRAARHLKQAKAAWNEAVREEAIGLLAAYFLEHRAGMLERARETIEMEKVQTVLEFPQSRKRA